MSTPSIIRKITKPTNAVTQNLLHIVRLIHSIRKRCSACTNAGVG